MQGVVFLDSNGESHDGVDDDHSSLDLVTNFKFIGDNISTGKSSIRSKNSTKKVGISFS